MPNAGWRGTTSTAPPPPEGFAARTSQTLPGEGRDRQPRDTTSQLRMRGHLPARENARAQAAARQQGSTEGAVRADEDYLNDPGKRGLLAVDPLPGAGEGSGNTAPVETFESFPAGDITRELLSPDDETTAAPVTSVSPNSERYGLTDNVGLEDLDRLFFWNRQDPEGVKNFLGWSPKNSVDLHGWFQRMVQVITNGKGAIYSILRADPAGEEHVGFIMLLPIVRTPGAAPVGTVHIFVDPARRGHFVDIVGGAVRDADKFAPGVTLFISPATAEMARLFERFGFVSGFHLVRKSTVTK